MAFSARPFYGIMENGDKKPLDQKSLPGVFIVLCYSPVPFMGTASSGVSGSFEGIVRISS